MSRLYKLLQNRYKSDSWFMFTLSAPFLLICIMLSILFLFVGVIAGIIGGKKAMDLVQFAHEGMIG